MNKQEEADSRAISALHKFGPEEHTKDVPRRTKRRGQTGKDGHQ